MKRSIRIRFTLIFVGIMAFLLLVMYAVNSLYLSRYYFEEKVDSLELASVVTHVADLRTCCLHPASTTHRQMSDEQLKEAGVPADLIRLSVGIENPQDIIGDIQQALEKAAQ